MNILLPEIAVAEKILRSEEDGRMTVIRRRHVAA
jgi:hypothetical protein